MDWFTNTFLKSIISNPKMKNIGIGNEIRKTCTVSDKQISICEKYMKKVNNACYMNYNGYHLEFNALGYNIRVDLQPKGYGILVMYKLI